MGTEAREELKAKQLEKVIYFAANLVTWVDEAKRHEDLPDLEAELGERDRRHREEARPRDRPPLQGARGRAGRPREVDGAKDAEIKARQRARRRRRSPAVRERFQGEIELAQRSFDEFKSLHSPQDPRGRAALARAAHPLRGVLRGRHGRRDHLPAHRPHRPRRRGDQAPRDDRRRRRAQAAVGPAPSEGHQAAEDRHRVQPARRERPPDQRPAGHDPRRRCR